ncbi:hypothetical protein [Alkalihalobacillus sp. AL-G]|uniref:hypothetical protein n=1 Tax=Alkalihalobacillus sp. AL-G TaxID=2926399 RepID=UPI00272AC174|nr:hypothetical protein [Alkalihalobacillus sp. AL-G]WLD92634.1 hypothetical protein MOJ78_16690 [Alkalihalobacillus sp. AL-G]
MSNSNGVHIPLREMYDAHKELVRIIDELNVGMGRIEEKLNILGASLKEADNRSREALDIAETALERADRALMKIEEQEREKRETRKQFYASVISSLIPWVILAIYGLVFLVKEGGVS